jgi:ATP-binding cassette, subfamily G (WHITE), member 2, SNQ2
MLDVIGAGATAVSTQNWHEIWNASKNVLQLQQELDTIHSEGRSRPPVETTIHSKFATSWLYQMVQLLKRDASAHWRNPTYLIAKLALNAIAGLFIGFTFFKSKDSQQGTQNKLFVRTSIFSAVLPAHNGCFYRLYSWQLSLGTSDFHISCMGTDIFLT